VASLVRLDLVLQHLGFDLEFAQLFAQALGVDAHVFSLLLAHLDLLLQHDGALDGLVVLGLHVLKGRRRVSCLSLKVVVGNFAVPQSKLESTVGVAKSGDFLLQCVLGSAGFGFGLLVFPLQFERHG
jgi:hypothetical protein